MLSVIIVKKRKEVGIWGDYWMNYSTEFDISVDIVLILFIFYANILFLLKADARR